MQNEELGKYIKETRSQGFSDEEIKKELQRTGWNESDFQEYFQSTNPATKPETPISSNKKALPAILATVFILVLGGGSYFAYATFLKPANVEIVENQNDVTPEANQKTAPEKTTYSVAKEHNIPYQCSYTEESISGYKTYNVSTLGSSFEATTEGLSLSLGDENIEQLEHFAAKDGVGYFWITNNGQVNTSPSTSQSFDINKINQELNGNPAQFFVGFKPFYPPEDAECLKNTEAIINIPNIAFDDLTDEVIEATRSMNAIMESSTAENSTQKPAITDALTAPVNTPSCDDLNISEEEVNAVMEEIISSGKYENPWGQLELIMQEVGDRFGCTVDEN